MPTVAQHTSHGTPGGEHGKECRAAIVTEVGLVEVNEQDPAGDGEHRQVVGLCVLNPTGQFLARGVLREELGDKSEPGRTGGTWHWPERV
jgi:hypothetical protein